jgi:hypothetical protein
MAMDDCKEYEYGKHTLDCSKKKHFCADWADSGLGDERVVK